MTKEELKNDGWNTVEKEVVRLEKENDQLQGLLVGVEDSKQYENKVYTIRKDDGKNAVLFGTTDLDSKMQIVPVGDMVRVTKLADVPTQTGRQMQVFKVEHRPVPKGQTQLEN